MGSPARVPVSITYSEVLLPVDMETPLPKCAVTLELGALSAFWEGVETAGLFSRAEPNTPPNRVESRTFNDRAAESQFRCRYPKCCVYRRAAWRLAAFRKQSAPTFLSRGKLPNLISSRNRDMGGAGATQTETHFGALG